MHVLKLSALAVAITLVGCADSPVAPRPDDGPSLHARKDVSVKRDSRSGSVQAQLAQVRRVTARFHDIDAAFAAGYKVWSPNPSAPNATCPSSLEGKMGYHLVNTDLRGSPLNPAGADAVLDPMKPEMLLYEKRADGKLHLVGVEYLVFKAAWEAAGNIAPPTLFGQTVPQSNHAFPPTTTELVEHYELHVWIWKPNPNGIFSHWNPNISC